MSKSIGNTIRLSDAGEEIKKKMKGAVTDPQKLRKGDPGHPDICLVFAYHNKFSPLEVSEIRTGCESGALGCVDCKMRCAEKISTALAPHRERRAYYETHLEEVKSILHDGEEKAKHLAHQTMDEVHAAMKLG
jgi:tryptophanyl-tRNA synthetase